MVGKLSSWGYQGLGTPDQDIPTRNQNRAGFILLEATAGAWGSLSLWDQHNAPASLAGTLHLLLSLVLPYCEETGLGFL